MKPPPDIKRWMWLLVVLSGMGTVGCAQWKAASKSPNRCPDAKCFPFGYENG